jgi:cysteine/glycine-rich protein
MSTSSPVPLSFFDTYPNCCVCDKVCYTAEQITVGDKVYHFNDDCWSCGVTTTQGCKKRLERLPTKFSLQLGIPYCPICFETLFLEGYGTKGNVLERPSGDLLEQEEPKPDVQTEIGAHASAVFRLSAPVEEESPSPSTSAEPISPSPSSSTSTSSASSVHSPKSSSSYIQGGFNNKCPACKKTVYKMEEIIHANESWHKSCFTCGGTALELSSSTGSSAGCKRVLSHGDFKTQAGVAYCNACFARQFMQGAAVGAVLPSQRRESTVGEVQHKFANLGGSSNKCPACSKTVYKMEEHPFEGTTWHKNCFTCGGGVSELGCKRVLAHGDYKAQAGVAFCNGCFSKHFVRPGARGSVLITGVSGAIEAPVAKRSDASPAPAPAAESLSSQGASLAERSAAFRMSATSKDGDDAAPPRRSSGTAERFANLGGGSGDKCPACSKTVYKMEAHPFEGTTWHKSCFTCGSSSELGCKRVLAHGDYKAQAGVAFCNACFAKHFMTAGARGAVLITSSGSIEARGSKSLGSSSVDCTENA